MESFHLIFSSFFLRQQIQEKEKDYDSGGGGGDGGGENVENVDPEAPEVQLKTKTTAFVQQECIDTMGAVLDEKIPLDLNDYSESLELLKEAGHIDEIQNRPQVTTLMPGGNKKKSLAGIVDRLRNKQLIGEEYDYYKSYDVYLEKIRQTRNAVFQVGTGTLIGEEIFLAFGRFIIHHSSQSELRFF